MHASVAIESGLIMTTATHFVLGCALYTCMHAYVCTAHCTHACMHMYVHVCVACAAPLTNSSTPEQSQRLFRLPHPVDDDYVLGLTETVKQMPIVSYAEGTVLAIVLAAHVQLQNSGSPAQHSARVCVSMTHRVSSPAPCCGLSGTSLALKSWRLGRSGLVDLVKV